jgi:hypothetical protein
MAKRERIGFYGRFTPAPVDMSQANKFKQLAGIAEDVGGLALSQAKRIREEQGLEAAETAVEKAKTVDPETGIITYEDVDKKSSFGFFGSAFNEAASIKMRQARQAAEATNMQNLDRDIRETVYSLEKEHEGNPVAFESALQSYTEGTIEGISSLDEDVQAKVINSLSAKSLSARNRVSTKYEADELTNNIKAQRSNIDEAISAASRLMARGDSEEALAELANIETMMVSVGNIDSTFDVKESMRRVKNTLYQVYKVKEFRGLVSEEGQDAAKEALIKFRDEGAPETYDALEFDAFVSQLNTEINKEASLRSAQSQEKQIKINKELDDVIAKLSMGFTLTKDEIDSANKLAFGTQRQSEIEDAMLLAPFNSQSYENQNISIASAEQNEEYALMSRMKIAQATQRNAIAKDPYTFAVRQGLIERADLNLSELGTDEFANSLEQRKEQAEFLSGYYGMRISPLEASEQTALKQALPDMDQAQKILLMDSFGSDSGLWGSIADAGDVGVFAQLAALGNDDVSRIALKGQEKQQLKGIVFDPKKSDYLTVFNDVVGDVYNLDNKNSTLQTAIAHYLGTTDEEVFNPNIFRRSIQAVTSGINKVRGYPTQMNGLTESEIEMYFDSITADDLAEMGAVPKSIVGGGFTYFTPGLAPVADFEKVDLNLRLIEEGRIKAVAGRGNYVVTAKDGQTITDRAGNEIVFNITEKKLSSILNSRTYTPGRRYGLSFLPGGVDEMPMMSNRLRYRSDDL